MFNVTDCHGRVEDRTALESRVRGIYITADNLGTILQGFGDGLSKLSYATKIARIINTRTRCFIQDDAQALGTVEQIWTGDSATTLSHPALSHLTLIYVQVRFWITQKWTLVRELNYLAITEEAHDDLNASWKSPIDYWWKRIPAQRLASFVKEEGKAFRGDFFLRCLKRQVLFLHHSPSMELRHDARINDKRGLVSELVTEIYDMHRIRQRKPNEAFIREVETIEDFPSV